MFGCDTAEQKWQILYILDLQSYRGQVGWATGWRMIEAGEDTPTPQSNLPPKPTPFQLREVSL